MKKTIVLLTITLITLAACSKESGEERTTRGSNLATHSCSLIFSTNNEPCLETNSVNDTQSSITFRWNPGQNVTSYDLKVVNLSNNTNNTYNATSNEKSLTLEHDEPYSWKVISNGQSGSQPVESDTWKFYLAGPCPGQFCAIPGRTD